MEAVEITGVSAVDSIVTRAERAFSQMYLCSVGMAAYSRLVNEILEEASALSVDPQRVDFWRDITEEEIQAKLEEIKAPH